MLIKLILISFFFFFFPEIMSSDAENVIRKYTCQQYIYQFVIWEYMYDLGFVGLLTRNC